MKNLFLLFLLSFFSLQSFAQWTYKTIDSDFDGVFKKAYTNPYNGGYLLMESDEFEEINLPILAIRGTYFCDDYTTVEMVFYVNGERRKHDLLGTKSDDSRFYVFYDFIWTTELISDFKKATKCVIRVNQSHCTDDYYTIDMTGSKAAFEFMTKEN